MTSLRYHNAVRRARVGEVDIKVRVLSNKVALKHPAGRICKVCHHSASRYTTTGMCSRCECVAEQAKF